MNFLYTASAVLFPLITFPYVSRVLGPAGIGAVAMGTSLVSYFTMIAMLGVPTYGIRACAKVRDNPSKLAATVSELMIVNLVMMVIAYSLFFAVLMAVPAFREAWPLYTVCSLAILLNVIGVNWVYQALEDYSYITMISLLFKVLGVGLMFGMVRSQNNVLAYALVTVVSTFGSGLFNFLRLRKVLRFKGEEKLNFRQHIRPVLTFFAMSVATTIYTSLDTLMLGLMKDDTAVGYYNAAIKIKSILVTLVTSLGTVLLPRLSYYFEHGCKAEIRKMVSQAFSFVLLFATPCALFCLFFARPMILLLSGAQYLPSIAPMNILTPTILLIGLSNIMGIQVLVPQGKENIVLVSVIAGALVDLVVNLLLIPAFGPSGAAWGTLLAELVVTLYQGYVLRDFLRPIVPTIEFRILFLAGTSFAGLAWACSLLPAASSFWVLMIGGVVCFGVYGLLLLVMHEQILMNLLKKLWKRKGIQL